MYRCVPDGESNRMDDSSKEMMLMTMFEEHKGLQTDGLLLRLVLVKAHGSGSPGNRRWPMVSEHAAIGQLRIVYWLHVCIDKMGQVTRRCAVQRSKVLFCRIW